MGDETRGGDPIDPLEGPTSPKPGSRDPDSEVVPAEEAEPVARPSADSPGDEGAAPAAPQSSPEGARIERSAARLAELAAALRDPDLDDSRAAELAAEAAELVGAAAADIDRARRAAGEHD